MATNPSPYSGGGFSSPMTTAGDMIDGGAAGVAQRLALGTQGYQLTAGTSAPSWVADSAWNSAFLAPGIGRETFPRICLNGQITSQTTGNCYMTAIALVAGDVVSNITLVASGAESGGSHAWVALTNSAGSVVAVSTDHTAATTTPVTKDGSNPYTVPSSGVYYVAVSVTASGMPTFISNGSQATVTETISPITGGLSGTTSATPPAVASTLTLPTTSSSGGNFYAYLS